MRNPPWIAPIIAPLGLFTFAVAQRLWLAGGLLAILISVKWLWDLYRVSGQSGLLTSLAVAVFSPIAVALTIGQICPLILLGIAGFLRFENGGRLNLAGMFLVLVALKPHLAFLLWVAVVLGAMFNRSARILWTFTLTTAMASLVAVLFDRSIFGEYLAFVRLEGVLHELTPTPGGFLRLLFRSYIFQILPPMIAFVWFLFYAGKKFRDSVWRWKEETPMLLLVSLLTTPYAWFFDQVLLIPCIFQSLSRLSMLRERRLWQSVAFLYVAANVLVLVLIRLHRPGFYYAWTPVFWFALFMLVRLQHDRSCSGTPTTLKAAPPADGWVGADSLPD